MTETKPKISFLARMQGTDITEIRISCNGQPVTPSAEAAAIVGGMDTDEIVSLVAAILERDPNTCFSMEQAMATLPEEPRAWTTEELSQRFVDHAKTSAHYWARADLELGSVKRRCEGAAYSVLCMLDGISVGIPGFTVLPSVHESDKAYNIGNGDNWVHDPGLTHDQEDCDIAGDLHRLFYAKERAENERREAAGLPTTETEPEETATERPCAETPPELADAAPLPPPDLLTAACLETAYWYATLVVERCTAQKGYARRSDEPGSDEAYRAADMAQAKAKTAQKAALAKLVAMGCKPDAAKIMSKAGLEP